MQESSREALFVTPLASPPISKTRLSSVLARRSAPHAALCTARHGVFSQLVPIALTGLSSIPMVKKVARHPCSSYWVSWRS
ncbi:MAG TPA: hypothetical protein VK466_12725 [Terriglobales bacterium]|nr:hypothetical protein [Terriglobales bacterium]